MVDIQHSITIMGGREVSRSYRVWFFAEGELFFMFLFQSPSIFPLNRYGTCIGFVWLFEQDVDEGGDVGGVDDGVAVDVAGVFVVRLFGAENHIDEHGDV